MPLGQSNKSEDAMILREEYRQNMIIDISFLNIFLPDLFSFSFQLQEI